MLDINHVKPGSLISGDRSMNWNPISAEPLVSVLMACYNGAAFLADSIGSLRRQTYPKFELIICDDGSTDDTPATLAALASADPRIKWLSKENGGMASAWNACWKISTGEIICFLDADDRFLPTKLTSVIKKVRAGFGLVIHPMIMVDTQRRTLSRVPAFSALDEGWLGDLLVRRGGRWQSQPTSAISFPRELAKLIFPIPEPPFRMNADAFVYTLLPLVAPVGVISEILSEYRVHGNNAILGKLQTAELVDSSLQFHQTLLDEVNHRFEAVCGVARILDPKRNIGFANKLLMRDLLAGRVPRRQLIRAFFRFCQLTIRDDLNSPSRKLVDILGLGTAIFMPRSRRAWWLWNIYGLGAAKRLVVSLQTWRPKNAWQRRGTR